jgi:hypothetical protein
MLSISSSILSTTGKHSFGQHVNEQILALEKSVIVILHKQLQHLSTPCTNPIKIGRMTMLRTQEITTLPACQYENPVKKYVTSLPKSDNFIYWFPYPTTKVIMAPIKEMP